MGNSIDLGMKIIEINRLQTIRSSCRQRCARLQGAHSPVHLRGTFTGQGEDKRAEVSWLGRRELGARAEA